MEPGFRGNEPRLGIVVFESGTAENPLAQENCGGQQEHSFPIPLRLSEQTLQFFLTSDNISTAYCS